MNEEELKKDILYDIEMQLYMEFNDKIATMNDYLGEIYSYKDVEDVKQAEQHRKVELMENAIKDLQERIDKTENYLYHLLNTAYLEESDKVDIALIEYTLSLIKGSDK